MFDKFEKYYQEQTSQLTEKEAKFFNGLFKWIMGGYKWVKPILLSLAMIWIFSRVKDAIGVQDAMFYAVVLQVVFLRLLVEKISKLTD